MNYSYYRDTFKGKLEESAFDELLPKAVDIMTMYANELCDSLLELREYGTFDKAICYQIDCINQFSVGSMNGAQGEQSITTVKTEGYTVEYSKSNQRYFLFKGMPLGSMAKMLMVNELKRNGHFKLLVEPC